MHNTSRQIAKFIPRSVLFECEFTKFYPVIFSRYTVRFLHTITNASMGFPICKCQYSIYGYVYTGAFYFMYGFKAIAFHPVHTNPFMFVYGVLFENFLIFKVCALESR